MIGAPVAAASRGQSWVQSRQAKVVLTIIAGFYLFAQLAGMAAGMIYAASGFGLEKAHHLPWPIYMLWIPGFVFQLGIISGALWLLWRPPRKGRLQPPPPPPIV